MKNPAPKQQRSRPKWGGDTGTGCSARGLVTATRPRWRGPIYKTLKNFEGSHRPTTWDIKRWHCWDLRCTACTRMFWNKVSLYKLKITQADSRNARLRWLTHTVDLNPQVWSFSIPNEICKNIRKTFRSNSRSNHLPFIELEPECTRMQETQVCQGVQDANAWKGEPQLGKFLGPGKFS